MTNRYLVFTPFTMYLAACSVQIPPIIKPFQIDTAHPDNIVQLQNGCIERLNNDTTAAEHSRNRSDATSIVGAIISAGSGLSSAILAASLPTDTQDDDHRGQKIGAAVTGGFAAISAVIAVVAKLIENPNEVLKRRSAAELHYVAGLKALSVANKNYAGVRFIDCATTTSPSEIPSLPFPASGAGAGGAGGGGAGGGGAGGGGAGGGLRPALQ